MMKGWVWRSSEVWKSRNSMRKGSPEGSLSALPSRLQPACIRSLLACANIARSCPEPSLSGGSTAGPKAASGIRPRNGSSSSASSDAGSPTAAMGVFWKNDTVL